MDVSFQFGDFDEGGMKKLNSLKQKIEDDFKNFNKDFIDKYNGMINKGIEEYVSPILADVINLPKDEMALLAESLIHLTSMKRKFSLDQDETVGGNIDVAILSKGDGFIWAKRKHYFDSKLNQHYIKNYEN